MIIRIANINDIDKILELELGKNKIMKNNSVL